MHDKKIKAYKAAVREREVKWFGKTCLKNNGWVYWNSGSSVWDDNLHELWAIEDMHGIARDDPRIRSISAYKREVAEIESEWQQLCKKRRWPEPGRPCNARDFWPDSSDVSFREFATEEYRCGARIVACRSRHFPASAQGNLDSIGNIWAHINFTLLHRAEFDRIAEPQSRDYRPELCDENLESVYSAMYRIGLDPGGNATPPRVGLTQQEIIDELYRLATWLEAEDANRCASVTSPESPGGETDSAGKRRTERKLRPCDELALNQFNFAMQQDASLETDQDVYNWLSECKSIDSLTSFANWSRYLRRARNAKGEGKNTPKIGNPTKSIVPKNRI